MTREHPQPPPLDIGLSLPNVMLLTRPLREFLALTLEPYSWSDDEVEEIGLVVTELANNSFEHASAEVSHHVDIRAEVDTERFVFRIRDIGEGRLRQEDFQFDGGGPPDHLEDRGRGLFLIQCFSDEVSVREVPEGGTEVRIVKYREREE